MPTFPAISQVLAGISHVPNRATQDLSAFDATATLFADEIQTLAAEINTWRTQANTLAGAINVVIGLIDDPGNPDILRFVRSPGDIVESSATTAPPGTLVADGSAVSRATYPDLASKYLIEPGFTPQAVMISASDPVVLTQEAHGFSGGERIRLSTTGVLPVGLLTTVDYFVVRLDANTITLSTTERTYTPVVTTGSGSGDHTYLQSLWGLGNGTTTFNLPNLNGVFTQGADATRTVGTYHKGTLVNADDNYTNGYGLVQSAGYGATSLNDAIGADPADLAAYPKAASVWVAATGGQSPPTGSFSGVARPNNVGLLKCVVY